MVPPGCFFSPPSYIKQIARKKEGKEKQVLEAERAVSRETNRIEISTPLEQVPCASQTNGMQIQIDIDK